MRYIALLRGINVGGNNKLPMAQLRDIFATAGMDAVSTYINSGNVLFEAPGTANPTAMAVRLERAIADATGLHVPVLLRDRDQLLATAAALPADWQNDTAMKCDAIFLWQPVDRPDLLHELTVKPDIDRVIYVPGALLWSVDRKLVTRSGLLKLAGSDLYKLVTIRNCNTLRALAARLA